MTGSRASHTRAQSNKSCAIAGETEVAEQRLSPVQLVGHLFCRPYKKRDRPPKAWKLLSKWISDLATFSPLPAKSLRWNTTQWAEILYEPSSFGKSEQASERVSLALELTAEMEKTVERLEKQASSQVAGKKLEAQLQSCMKQTRANRQSLKLKATLSKVRFWDADGNRLMGPPAELRGRKALLTIEARQLWIMGQQCGLLVEVRDIKLQDASSPECPL